MLIKNYKYFKNLIIYLFCILICAQANSMHCNTVQQEQTHYYTNINNIPNEVYQVINNIYHARINNYSNTNIWSILFLSRGCWASTDQEAAAAEGR